ncbi:MAG TPA: N-acetyl-gamma-glutamyl-phosphate reductase [Polyangiaceae bacterium]|jgi:N-acetyl-gamma-glutamyl-phosphate reductase|nr:N-acetyl-gamma-glutamyl-phosphate reductase [Polyangiaceae bacterium]
MATSRRFKAAVIGATGYGGAELIRRLLGHPEVELARAVSIDHVGEPIASVHPNLEGRTDLRFEDLPAGEAAKGMDVVFLGLPHGVSAAKVPEVMAAGARIVDLSGDFRVRSPATYAKYYGAEHPHPVMLTSDAFVYGLPELHRERLRGAKYVASPGCFATTIELALLPLAAARLLAGPVEVVGVTGSSGSGVAPSAGTHHPVRANNLRTYKPLEHQHVPEIEQLLGDVGGRGVTVRFVPVSAPLVRGIFATCFAHVDAGVDPASIAALYRDRYAAERFVRVPARRLPEVVAVKGTNVAEVGVVPGDVENGQRLVTCFAALDNLIKGGAGQAIQSMNLMLGLDERLTLDDLGGWP